MVREWVEVEGGWYYMGTDGVMVKDQAVGEYYVKEDGRMAKNEEIKGVYYGADGKRVITDDPEYARRIFSIERGNKKPRKDIGKWSEVKDYIAYFYDDLFDGRRGFPEALPAQGLHHWSA